MTSTIHLTTFVEAPIKRVFDLSRSIDLHIISTEGSGEKAIGGVTSGLINVNETVSWEAKHFFKKRKLTSLITAMDVPYFFCDEMTEGDFKTYRHEHYFKPATNGTIMIDKIFYELPYGMVGRITDTVFMKGYLRKLLSERNRVIKDFAESVRWKEIPGMQQEQRLEL